MLGDELIASEYMLGALEGAALLHDSDCAHVILVNRCRARLVMTEFREEVSEPDDVCDRFRYCRDFALGR